MANLIGIFSGSGSRIHYVDSEKPKHFPPITPPTTRSISKKSCSSEIGGSGLLGEICPSLCKKVASLKICRKAVHDYTVSQWWECTTLSVSFFFLSKTSSQPKSWRKKTNTLGHRIIFCCVNIETADNSGKLAKLAVQSKHCIKLEASQVKNWVVLQCSGVSTKLISS